MKICKILFLFGSLLMFVQCRSSQQGSPASSAPTTGSTTGGGGLISPTNPTTGATGSGSTTGTTTIGGGPSTDLTCSAYNSSHNILQYANLVSAYYYSRLLKTVNIDLINISLNSAMPFSPQANVTVMLNRGTPVSQNFTIDTQAGQIPISSTGVYVTTVAVNMAPIITVGLIQLPATSQVSIKVKLYSKSNSSSLLREVECKNY